MSDRRPSNRRYLKPGKHERRGRHEAPPPFTARQYLVAVTSMWLDFKMLTERGGDMSERDYSEGDAPIYEEAVDEYLALVNGPMRVIGNGSISPPVDEDSAHLLAVVRRGVESGTIKGTEMEVVPTEEPRQGPHGEPIQQEPHIVSSVIEPARCLLDPGTYLVIGPVSDGGSET